ncbi:MAG: PKD domain-containing protein [Deltaproteobacteria bacterium]|nr:PKD domain-containing protein [Deltaproteobacteria bacterium]
MQRTIRLLTILAGLVLFSLPASAFASHFRGASITWTRSSASSQVLNFNITHSWRCCPGMNLVYGGGSPSSQSLASNQIGSFTDSSGASYQTYSSSATHTYPGNGPYTAYFQSNARIGGMGFASNQSFRVESVVNLNGGNTASPAIGTSALLQLVRGAQNSVALAIVDPDNSATAVCGWATCSQAGVSSSQCSGTGGEFRPTWLSLNPTTCVLSGTPPTSGAILWPYAVRVTDNNNAVTTFDGMIELVTGTPPTCSGGGNFNATVGQPFSTSFVGSNPSGGTITMQLASGPPTGTLSPLSGSSPLTSTFNWTPAASDFGQTYAATVIVSNSSNLQTTCPLGLTVPLNSPPVAEANGPYTGSKSTGVAVTGAGSIDADGTISTYEWDCDNNGSYEVSSASATGQTCGPYTLGGAQTIVLRVTDDQGSTDTDTATVNVPNVGPTANAGGPYSGNQGTNITISGTGSSDGDGGSLTYTWDCDTSSPPGGVVGGSTTTCSYDDGTYTGSLTVCDPEGLCVTDTFTVTAINLAPTANAGGPYTTGQGVAVSVSGSNSTDPDGTIATYEWDCDTSNGISYSAPSASPTSNCTWPDDGTYTISLRVTDDDGATATATATANVTNTAPIANAGGPYTGQKNTQIAVSGSTSSDPDGNIVLYQWDCDASDGVSLSAGSAAATSSCTYTAVGTYTVTLQVTDDDGATDTDTATVTIANVAPNANAGGPYSAVQGALVTLDGSQSSDPDGTIVSYRWDCNVASPPGLSAAQPSSTFGCTYPAQGTYTASLQVTDDDGATDLGTATIVVTNQAPVAEAGGPYNGNQGVAMPVFGFGSVDPDGSLTTYEWDCDNNGTYEVTTTSPTGTTCTFATIGTYTINLRVTDDDGATATDSATALIGNQVPVSAPGGPYSALQNQTVNVDGSSSTDTDGTLVDYSWDCDAGNGVSLVSTGTSSSTTCTYSSVGTYTITLQVTDDDGATDTQTTTVLVSNGAPVAVAGGPYTGVKNVAVTVDGSGSSDPDGTLVSYAWDCDNDGIVDVTSASPTNSCIYGAVGVYTLSLTVTDNDGGTSTDTGTVNVPAVNPIADAGGPYAGIQNVPIALDASGSSDSDGNIVTYEWDCEGDGVYEFTSFNANDVTCTYAATGTYTLQLQVTDDDGLMSTDTALVTLTNILPVADAGGPYTGTEASPVAMDGSGSGDADGTIVSYSWDCDSDGLPEVILPTPNGASCTFTASGTYTVTLTVTDDDGATDSDTASLTVLSSPPVASAGGPYSGDEGSLILLDGSGSSDAGGSITLYQWDCTSDGSYDISATQPLGNGCLYDDEGNYTVTLQVTDDDGDTSIAVATIAVANVAPTLSGPNGPLVGDEGASLNWTAVATDPGVFDVLSYSWDFGDGESATGSSAAHVYLQDGTYNLTVTVTDGDGGSAVNTVQVVIGNLPPILTVWTIPIASDEGQLLNFTAEATDPGILDVLTYSWDFGDGSSGETGDIVNYAFADDGSYTITLTVTDDGGLTDTVSQVISVANVDPTITSMTGDLSGFESQVLSWTATATDPGILDVLTYTWDFGDGNTATGPNVSNAYVNEGTFIVTLTVDDGDGGVDIETLSVEVFNDAPIVTSVTAPDGDEGVALSFSIVATDNGINDVLTYLWDFGDGSFATGDTATKTFDDDGLYVVTCTVTDDGGEFTTVAEDVLISNVAPVITSMVALPDTTPDEGTSVDLEATATDQGAADIPDLIYTWDFGNGAPVDTGSDSEFTYPDDGTFIVTLTVDDQDGGVTTQTLTLEVQNVDPIISTNPVVNANQGSLYSYAPQVVDPGDEVFTWTLSPGAPPTMTIDAATGLIEWTPTYADYLTGTHAVVLTVDDGDGGIAQQSWTITVFDTDTDGDGIPDDWEITNGLDPNDPTDAGDDPDGDGITNLGEFGLDQDPNVYDGPSQPTPVSPIDGDEITEVSPDLVFDNATDPQGETLLYDLELYEDELMTILVTSTFGVIEDSTGQTFWKVDVQLNEDQEYWWHVRANDPWVAGEWSDPENFILNEFNDGPDVPELVYPIDGEVVTVLQPELEWTQVEDPNEDEVTYDIVVYAADEVTVVAEATGVVDSGNATSTWMVDVALTDDANYWWSARAVDDEGLAGDWAELEDFFLTTENGAPDQPVFIDPEDGDQIIEISPTLTATEVQDPEGGEVTYEFEIDQAGTFDTTDYRTAMVPATDTGTVWWDLSDAGIELDENEWAFARVRAIDELGIASAPDTITFFVRGENDAPGVPTLIRPEDGSTVPGLGVTLVLQNVEDLEDDLVFYDFLLATDPEMTEVVFEANGVANGAGPADDEDSTSVLVPETLLGVYYWTARARDDEDGVSDWAIPNEFTATGDSDSGPFIDPDSFVGGAGCKACASSVSAADQPATLWLLALLPVAMLARRRRS